MLKHDPIEDTPEFQAIKDEVERKVVARVGKPSGMGYCHKYWYAKAQILREEYGITWRSPAIMNPGVIFD